MKTDSLFYRIFQTAPAAFFDLIGTPTPQAHAYRFTSEEIKQTSFRIDGIFTPPPASPDLPLYFIEVMGYRDTKGDLYPGLFSEIFLYLNIYRPANDWRTVLIFTHRRYDPGLPIHYSDFATSPRFQRLYLDELSPAIADRSLALGILYLVGLAAETAPDHAKRLIARARQELTDRSTQQQTIELIQTVLVYKFPNLTTQELEAMLGLSDLKQTRVYQEAQQEAIAAMTLRQLKHRFGNIYPDLEAQIRSLPIAQAEELTEALLDFSTLSDLQIWLQNQALSSN